MRLHGTELLGRTDQAAMLIGSTGGSTHRSGQTHRSALAGKAEFVRPEQFDFAPGRLHESSGLGETINRDAPSRHNRESAQAEAGARFVLVGENASEPLERSNRWG